MSFLTLVNVNKRFGLTSVVERFNLQVERGEFISFLGPSGCGKTTTLRMIAGFETPTSGTITVDGKDVTTVPPNRRHVGMVFQSYALFPNMTIADNIGFGLRVTNQPSKTIRTRVQEMLDLIHLGELGSRYPYQLSGGQQQRVALARALAIRPTVLLLDEPLSALDAKIRVSLRQEIRAIQRQLSITTIYVTHDQEEALSLSDRIVVMSAGQVEQIGTPFEVYNFPQTPFVASFVGSINLLKADVVDETTGRLRIDDQEIVLNRALPAALVGVPISLSLRPEVIRLDPQASGCKLRASVQEITFLGSIVRLRLRLDHQGLHFDMLNNPNLVLPTIGQAVTVGFPSEACMIQGETAVHIPERSATTV